MRIRKVERERVKESQIYLGTAASNHRFSIKLTSFVLHSCVDDAVLPGLSTNNVSKIR